MEIYLLELLSKNKAKDLDYIFDILSASSDPVDYHTISFKYNDITTKNKPRLTIITTRRDGNNPISVRVILETLESPAVKFVWKDTEITIHVKLTKRFFENRDYLPIFYNSTEGIIEDIAALSLIYGLRLEDPTFYQQIIPKLICIIVDPIKRLTRGLDLVITYCKFIFENRETFLPLLEDKVRSFCNLIECLERLSAYNLEMVMAANHNERFLYRPPFFSTKLPPKDAIYSSIIPPKYIVTPIGRIYRGSIQAKPGYDFGKEHVVYPILGGKCILYNSEEEAIRKSQDMQLIHDFLMKYPFLLNKTLSNVFHISTNNKKH